MTLRTDDLVKIKPEHRESNQVTIDGRTVSFDAAVNLMDDDIRETLHILADCDADRQTFADLYCDAHYAQYGETFTVA
jgi:small nuclear ribonucleoprotein (snRNP)-like protein